MNSIKPGDIIEAVDEFGVWARARVLKNDSEVLVSFVGFSEKWNRSIKSLTEIRACNELEVPSRRSGKRTFLVSKSLWFLSLFHIIRKRHIYGAVNVWNKSTARRFSATLTTTLQMCFLRCISFFSFPDLIISFTHLIILFYFKADFIINHTFLCF